MNDNKKQNIYKIIMLVALAKTELPKTGINTIVYITMAIVGIVVVSFIILNKKYKDIK